MLKRLELLELLKIMETTNLVIEHDFDETTVDELSTLREIRVGLTEKLMSNPAATVDEMIRRGIVKSQDRDSFIAMIKGELENKLKVLNQRRDENTFYFDEIGLYSDLITSK